MSTGNPAPQTAQPASKPRNPVERLLVRGFIGVMLVLVAVETWFWWSHSQAATALLKMTKAVDDATPNTAAVTETDVKAIVGDKKPSRSENVRGQANSNGASRLDVFSWFTISPINKREIYVYYGFQGPNDKGPPEVLAVQLSDTVPPTTLRAAGNQPQNNGGAGAPPKNVPPRGAGGRPEGEKNVTSATSPQDSDKPDTATPDSEDSTGESSPDEKPADEKPAEPDTEKDPQ